MYFKHGSLVTEAFSNSRRRTCHQLGGRDDAAKQDIRNGFQELWSAQSLFNLSLQMTPEDLFSTNARWDGRVAQKPYSAPPTAFDDSIQTSYEAQQRFASSEKRFTDAQ